MLNQKLQSLDGLVSKKAAVIVTTIILLLAMIAAPAGSFGPIGTQRASAHLGDWWTQYNVTHDKAVQMCFARWSNCSHTSYQASYAYGDHSRVFYWYIYNTSGSGCNAEIKIGHEYGIFGATYWYCW